MQEQPGQALIADRVREAQIQRQREDVYAERTACLHARGYRRHGDAAAARTVSGILFHPGHHRTDRRKVDLVISAVQHLVGLGQGRLAMHTAQRPGDHRLIWFACQESAAALTAETTLPRAAAPGLVTPVGLLAFRRRQARIVRRLWRLPKLCLQFCDATFGRSEPLEQRLDQRVLLGMAQLAEIEIRRHLDVESSRP